MLNWFCILSCPLIIIGKHYREFKALFFLRMNHSLLHQRRQDLVKRMLLLQHCLNDHRVDALVGTPVCSIPWAPETFRGFRFSCFSQVFLVTLMAWACSLHQWQRIPVHGRKTPGTQSNSMAYVMLNWTFWKICI